MGPDSPADEEIRRFEEQYRRQPESLVFARLADAYRKAGDPGKALEVLEDGLVRHPDYPSGHIVRARALRDLGRIEETLQSFRRVLELDAANLVAIRELAGLADERGDSDEARHWYERLSQMDPADLEVRQRLVNLESEVAAAGEAGGEEATQGAQDLDAEGAQDLDAEGPQSWWDDSAVGLPATDGGAGDHPEYGSISWEEDDSGEGRRPEDAVVEAILNGDVPETVRAEDTWWYEEASESEEPAPSRDADLLTRTMADLYAEQGLHREAAQIYEELLKDSPGDPDLLERLEAVRQASSPPSRAAAVEEHREDAEQGMEVADLEPGAEPSPLGRPRGTPWTEELRRLLRTGEQRAGDLPDPEGTGGVAAAAPGTEAGAEVDDTDGMSRFAREWIRGLGTDA